MIDAFINCPYCQSANKVKTDSKDYYYDGIPLAPVAWECEYCHKNFVAYFSVTIKTKAKKIKED